MSRPRSRMHVAKHRHRRDGDGMPEIILQEMEGLSLGEKRKPISATKAAGAPPRPRAGACSPPPSSMPRPGLPPWGARPGGWRAGGRGAGPRAPGAPGPAGCGAWGFWEGWGRPFRTGRSGSRPVGGHIFDDSLTGSRAGSGAGGRGRPPGTAGGSARAASPPDRVRLGGRGGCGGRGRRQARWGPGPARGPAGGRRGTGGTGASRPFFSSNDSIHIRHPNVWRPARDTDSGPNV